MMTARSFEEIRLPFLPGNPSGTRAAGAGESFCNDNTLRLRTFCLDALRLAGRIALTQLRSVVEPCRAILPSTLSDAAFMVQAGPCGVVVPVPAYPPFIVARHVWPLRVEAHSTTGDVQGVGQAISDLGKGADYGRCH